MIEDDEAQKYYTEEACGTFARALCRRFGYKLRALVDYENRWSRQTPGVVHVYAYDPRTDEAIDVTGRHPRATLIERWVQKYWEGSLSDEEIDEARLSRWQQDHGPLMPCPASELAEADAFITTYENRYCPNRPPTASSRLRRALTKETKPA